MLPLPLGQRPVPPAVAAQTVAVPANQDQHLLQLQPLPVLFPERAVLLGQCSRILAELDIADRLIADALDVLGGTHGQ